MPLPTLPLKLNRGAPGVNVNQLVDEERYDPITGNAALNGVPVEVEACVASSIGR